MPVISPLMPVPLKHTFLDGGKNKFGYITSFGTVKVVGAELFLM